MIAVPPFAFLRTTLVIVMHWTIALILSNTCTLKYPPHKVVVIHLFLFVLEKQILNDSESIELIELEDYEVIICI